MSASFFITLTEQEFKDFLRSAIKEIIEDDLKKLSPSLSDILNVNEAAAFLKVKITTLYEKTSKKLVPHFKKGNKLYFNRKELEEWIKNGKVKTRQEMEGMAANYLLNEKRKERKTLK